jgi:hypothetical protein
MVKIYRIWTNLNNIMDYVATDDDKLRLIIQFRGYENTKT